MTEILYDMKVRTGKINLASPSGHLFIHYKHMKSYQEFMQVATLAKDVNKDVFRDFINASFPYMEKDREREKKSMEAMVKKEQARGPMIVTPLVQMTPRHWRKNAKHK